jgi:enhancing lycopene biosynthesis protein 2
MRKRIALVVSGCGHKDGSEITEVVSAFISLSELGALVTCYAPSVDFQPIQHGSSPVIFTEKRNSLEEAARICRGQVKNIAQLNESDFDAVIFPGGSGAVDIFSDWQKKGAQCQLLPDVRRVLETFHASAKPIGSVCLSSVIVGRALGSKGISLTVGDNDELIRELEKTGARHVKCAANDYISDRDNKVLSTPAYLYRAQPHEIYVGIRAMIRELVGMA